ncbi:hypothetical protein Tco_1124901 [Tanacetum coccineum]|uniref:Uncharacterized protein n=1 Tax=Tanacetum coccineum TaxID=301880 RepID=A0ABQ5J7F4_9ASTR
MAITTTTAFEVSHEDAYDSNVDEAPHAAAAFMANLMQTDPSTGQDTRNDTDFHSEVQTYDNHFFDNMHLQVAQEIHRGEQLDFDVDSVIDDHDNTIPYHQYQLNNEVESVPTNVSYVVPGGISVITILDDLRSQLTGHIKTNKEQSFANDSLKAELERYKTQDLHKSALGHRNPLYLKSAQLCRPTLYLGDVIVDPLHTLFRVYDSEETLVQAEVSRTKMLERKKDPLCKVSSKPINYAKLNSLYDTFMPQKQLSSEQVYWLPTNEVVSYNCNQSKPITTFVRTRLAKSQVYTQLKMLKACFPELDKGKDQEVIDIISVNMKRIKNDSLRDENLSIKKRYQDLYQYKAESNSNVSSRASVPEKPKVLAPGLYAMTPKYIPPQKINNREANTPLPNEREVASAKPHHMIAPGSSRYSSNGMVHNHYLEEAKKHTHEIGRNSKTSMIPSARSQSIANGSKPKPRINNQKSRNWPTSKTKSWIQQKALDDALVEPENRLKIRKSNQRLSSTLKSNEPTIQVALDALKLTPFFNAFEVSADVPEIYMQDFWATVTKHHFLLHPLFEEEILSFIRDLGHIGEIKVLSDVNVNHLHQPWRSFAAIINKCLNGKTTALESLRLSRAQILWGMYHNKIVDYAYLMWEDLVYQVEKKNSKKNNDMYYLCFTKFIVDYFMAKDHAIPRRNKIFWHYARDDFMFTTIRVISKHQDTQVYGAILPQHLTNQAMLESEAYKTYLAYVTGEKILKPKYGKNKVDSESSPKKKTATTAKGKRLKTSAKEAKPEKKHQHAKTSKAKGLTMLSEVALTEADQMKIATKRSLIETHSYYANGSGNEEDDDEVGLNDNDDDNDDDEDNDDDDDDADNQDDDQEDDGQDDEDQDDVNEQIDSGNDGDDFVHPKLSTQDQEVRHNEEESDEEIQGMNVEEEELDEEETNDEDEANELYKDLNVNLEGRDIEMTDAQQTNVQTTQVIEDTHVIITPVNLEGQQQSSSVSSEFVSNMLNPSPDTGIDSIFNLNTESNSLIDVPVTTIAEPPLLSTTTLPLPPTLIITHLQQTPVPTPAIVLSSSLQDLPNFGSLFGELRYYTGSELGSELTLLASSELKTSELDTSELKTSEHRMGNLSEDIQCAGSDTRPPMLDRTDFTSWKQRIRLYCRGKDNGMNILKSINEGPFQMETFWETLAEGNKHPTLRVTKGHLHSHQSLHLCKGYMGQCEDASGRFRIKKEDQESQLYDDFEHFRQNKGETIHDYYVRFAKLINDMRIIKMTMSRMQLNLKFVNNMLPEWGRFQHKAHANENKMMLDRFTQHTVDPLALMSNLVRGAQNRVRNANPGQTRWLSVQLQRLRPHSKELHSTQASPDSEYFKDKMLLMQAQENRVALDEEQLLFIAGGQDNAINEDVDEQHVQDLSLNVDNVFQTDDCDAFDSDVDKAPTAQTMFMANLSSAYPVYDEVDPSYDSDILSEVHDHDHYQDVVCEHHEDHEMYDDVQPNYVVDSHANYTSDNNMIPYDQYVKDNVVPVVQNNVSSVPNDAYMMIFNDMHEPHAQSVSDTIHNTIVDNSLTAKLATYKEQVELYEIRVRFELTKREQKIDEQLRIVITDRNIKEENLKKELHSVKMQLASTINHNKSMVEEVTSLKKDFKQKENKYLEEFLDMKALKEKVEDKLYKQDQSLQTVHMLCKPKPYYNEQNKVAIGYKNPLCLTRAKQVQPALYNGYEIIKNNHVPALVHNTEDTLEIAEITRRKMNDKMKDPECVTHKVKIAPPDYSKENYLATFTPQKQLTPKQIFWSQDLIKMKEEALKKQTTASRPIKALTVYLPNTPATLVPRVLPTKIQKCLKQHEAHANENKMMLDRFAQHTVDPLALMSNVSYQQYYSQSSTTPPSTYVPPHFTDNSQLDSGLSPTDNLIENLTNTLALLTQSYKTYLPQTNNQLRTSSNPRNQATDQDGRVVV